jgi:hypothetical protein
VAECVLCGNTIGRGTHSRQHVFPDWLEQFFIPQDEAGEPIEYQRKLKRRGEQMRTEEWRDLPFNMKVKVLCKPCNNEWCNELENAAKPLLIPMIGGNKLTLTAVDQTAIATWATLLILMLQLTHRDGERSIADDAYRWFRKWGAPLPNEQIWIALYDGAGEWPVSYRHYGMSIYPAAVSKPPEDLNAHGLVITIGYLAIVGFGHTLGGSLQVSPQRGAPTALLRALWPTLGDSVEFPGIGLISGSDGLDALVEGFGDADAFHADQPQETTRTVVPPR